MQVSWTGINYRLSEDGADMLAVQPYEDMELASLYYLRHYQEGKNMEVNLIYEGVRPLLLCFCFWLVW